MRRIAALVVLCGLVASCGDAAPAVESVPATSSSAAPPTSVSVTTVVPVATTVPVAPTFPEGPSTVSVPEVPPRPRNSAGACARPDGSHYCVWGTKPLDLTVNNSRFASFSRSIEQSFTALSGRMSSIETELGASAAGAFEEIPAGEEIGSACFVITVTTESGAEVGVLRLVATARTASHEPVSVPLEAPLVAGLRYRLRVSPGPACAGMTFTAMVAMSSNWKYPQASGALFVDGRKSNGSLWARVD
ncbi:MAG: hypothetical protein EBT79_13385 [Actinobacteria bacterium]|nr:hypothetical protein [Actinomycetota bacterium]